MRPLPFLISIAVMAAIWATDATQLMGAHPWWSGKAVYIGAPVGLVLAVLPGLRTGPRWPLALFAGATLLALYIAAAGKADFAASYAEDRFAGRMWYFGWMAAMAGLAGMIYTLLRAVVPKPKDGSS